MEVVRRPSKDACNSVALQCFLGWRNLQHNLKKWDSFDFAACLSVRFIPHEEGGKYQRARLNLVERLSISDAIDNGDSMATQITGV
jgi:hypothetical protein